MLFDSHTHINEDDFTEAERREILEEVGSCQDLSYVMDVGFDLPSSRVAIEDANLEGKCYAVVGVHPHDAKTLSEEGIAELIEMSRAEKVKAIGEIGLDFHYDLSPRDVQRYWFRRQLQMALELGMPIVIHSREADQETFDILKEEGVFSEERTSKFPKRIVEGKEVPDARVDIHCFSGSLELAKEYIALGATIGICGPVTYKNNKKTVRVCEGIPIECIMVETDAPYLTPVPLRGKPNRPWNVKYTAEKVAELKGMTYDEVCRITCENAKRFYNI